MSDVSNEGISRPLLIVLGVVLGAGALFLLWSFIVQPLLGPEDPDEAVLTPVTPADPEASPPPLPDDGADGAPDDAQDAVPDDADQLEELLALGAIDDELFELAGARDPFRQVVIAAQVDGEAGTTTAPGGATSDGTDPSVVTGGGTGTGGTATGGTGSGGTGTGGTGSGGTGSGTGGTDTTPDDAGEQYGTGDDVADAGPDGVDALSATGLDTLALAVIALLLLVAGALTLRHTKPQI